MIETVFGILWNEPPENAAKGKFGLDEYIGKSAFVKSFHYVEKNQLESTAAFAAALRDSVEKAISKSDLVLAGQPSSRGAMNDKNNDVILFYEGDKIEGSVKLFITPTDTGAIRVVGIIIEHPNLATK
ncbi:MAG: hypothetical protein IH897_09320 [Planctomycetes bacterium]|nr:hypothetical protein [Planctomycetota bacterium]